MQHIEALRRQGKLQQILSANKYDLSEMIQDKKQFIKLTCSGKQHFRLHSRFIFVFITRLWPY